MNGNFYSVKKQLMKKRGREKNEKIKL